MTSTFWPMLAALPLGWLIAYERYHSGRASGTKVYCIVCTTSYGITHRNLPEAAVMAVVHIAPSRPLLQSSRRGRH
jgi:uncharacterized membrane protein YhiD involved in acid resistance